MLPARQIAGTAFSGRTEKNRKKGCVLGKENCYYLIEPPKGPSKCEGCPYKRAKPCVLVPCYKDLMAPLEKRGDAK